MIQRILQYLKRTKGRARTFTIINIFGFSLALATAFCTFLYVLDEIAYDKFHEHYKSIHQIVTINTLSEPPTEGPYTPLAVGDALRTADSSLCLARVFQREVQLEVGNRQLFKEKYFVFADPDIFRIFSFEFAFAKPEMPSINESEIAISVSLATSLFGNPGEAVGKTILLENKLSLTVCAVFSDWPAQSSRRFNALSHFSNYLHLESKQVQSYLTSDWLFTPVTTFILVKGKATPLEKLLNKIKETHADERVKNVVQYRLKRFSELYLFADFAGSPNNKRITYIYILLIIGITILYLACINFINLQLARSIVRVRELSIRNILGATKAGIVRQYLQDSFTFTLISLILSIVGIILFIDSLNDLFEKQITTGDLLNPYFLMIVVFAYLVLACATGLVPALMITRIRPVMGVRKYFTPDLRAGEVLRPFVISQFVVTSILILFTIVVHKQIDMLEEKTLGFEKERLVNIPLFMQNMNNIFGGVDQDLRSRMNAFETELVNHSGIEAVTASSSVPGEGTILALVETDLIKSQDNVFFSLMSVDYDFIDVYRIPLLSGRNFSKLTGSDHLEAIIINQQARKELGFQDDSSATGQYITIAGLKGRIVGVVKDFHFQGLQEQIRPLALEVNPTKFRLFSIRLTEETSITESLLVIKETWKKFFPDRFYEWFHLEDFFNKNYKPQFQLQKFVESLAIVASLICMMGLFGLTEFTNSLEFKQIGIRKILGASNASVLLLLLVRQKTFIIFCIIVGFPIGYWMSELWLGRYVDRIHLSWELFIFTYSVIAVLVLLSTSFHFIKSCRINPLDVIKSEV